MTIPHPQQASKPAVVIACPPVHGHTLPFLSHATALIKKEHSVHFLAGVISEPAIRKTGASFYAINPVHAEETISGDKVFSEDPAARLVADLKSTFVDLIPQINKVLREVLEKIQVDEPGRKVVIIQEAICMGCLPFVLGAPLPKGYDKFSKVIIFPTFPITFGSIDHAPFGPGIPPDASEEGRAKNKAMYDAFAPLEAEITDYLDQTIKSLGATSKPGPFFSAVLYGGDRLLQPCSQSLEYPRSDLSQKVQFIGGNPKREVDLSELTLPEWWGELGVAKKAGKKVVFISQGTYIHNYTMLLAPALEALADEDYFIVATLGEKGGKLDDITVPANAKLLDFFPYDAILPYVDVFVSNAGYGGFMTSVMHGVPLVLAGEGQDKAEVASRGEYAGVAINLRTSTPTKEAIKEAVQKVLTDKSFKERVVEIQHENEDLDCFAQLERTIEEFAN